jgi:peroxiredoxin
MDIIRPALFLLISWALISGCQEAAKHKNQTTTENAGFTAQPSLVAEQDVVPLKIGEKAPDFNLPDVDGKFYGLDDFKDAKALTIIFSCNHCPTAQAYEERMKAIVNDYNAKGVAVVAISPNSPMGLLYEELGYSDLDDDYKSMQIRSRDAKYNFPYLYDGDTQEASIRYGPAATPQVYVFDQKRHLQYVGRLDSSEKPGTANAEDLRLALDAVLNGQSPAVQETKAFGCSTKWGWKVEWKEKIENDWAQKPVHVEKIDVDGTKQLVKNQDSEKLRLINVWATWCGPCIIEYPEFIVLQRMYGARDFEFVSVSADKPDHDEKVFKFLKDKSSAVKNYHFSQDDKYALIEAIDPEWNGALPYTVLIEPGGNVVWRHQGEVDFLALKRAIVDHEMIGMYY